MEDGTGEDLSHQGEGKLGGFGVGVKPPVVGGGTKRSSTCMYVHVLVLERLDDSQGQDR